MNTKIEVPEDDGDALANAIVKSIVGGMPIVGPALTEIVGLTGNNYQRRVDHWIHQITGVVNRLNDMNITVQNLQQNEAFFSFLLHATPIAIKNHQAEKIEALRNAMLSVADEKKFEDEDMAFTFLRYIDELSVTHLKLLRAVSEYRDYFNHVKTMQAAHKGFMHYKVIPDLSPDQMRLCLRELDTKSLLHANDLEDLDEFQSQAGYIQLEQSDRTPLQSTQIGEKFMQFITDIKQQPDAQNA